MYIYIIYIYIPKSKQPRCQRRMSLERKLSPLSSLHWSYLNEVAPLPKCHPPGWHYFFRTGDPNLNFHLELLLGEDHTRGVSIFSVCYIQIAAGSCPLLIYMHEACRLHMKDEENWCWKKSTAKLRNTWPACVFNPCEEYSSISIGTKILQNDTKWTWE